MNTSMKMRAMAAGTFAVMAQVVLPAAPVLAVSGTATITRLIPASGPAGTEITAYGEGCVTNGVPNSAEVLLRGPGASTTVVSRLGAFFPPPQVSPSLAPGSFLGLAGVPTNAVTGSTYTVSARCIEQGQPPGPESAGVVFTVTAPGTGIAVPDRTTSVATTTGVSATTRAATTTGVATTTGAATTTGRATPIPSQPRFTG